MTATRLNAGRQNGMFLAQIGAWNLLQTADNRYKVAAVEPVNGKANYAFGVKEDGRLDTHLGLDCTKLNQDRPELFKSVEAYFKEKLEADKPKSEESDPYGDMALSRRRKLTPEQNWRRGLLQMRRIEFEHAAVKRPSMWESAVRMLWAALFPGTKITDSDLQTALRWIVQRQGDVGLKELLQLEQDYYAGKFAPQSSAALETRLNALASGNQFENVEDKEDGNEGNPDAERDRTGVGTAEIGGAEQDRQPERQRHLDRSAKHEGASSDGREPRMESRAVSETAPSARPQPERDPFEAFR